MKFLPAFVLISVLICFISCDEKDEELDAQYIDPSREIAHGVEVIYSDSAIIKFKIIASLQESYEEDNKLVEEYPEGLYIEFYDSDGKIISSVRSNYAKKVSADGLMTLRDNVVLVNHLGDRLATTGIIWDELNKTLRTSKFVQLVKEISQDTFYGFGFEASDDFSRFSIIQVTGKRRYQNLTKELGE